MSLRERGLTRAIGVCNFNLPMIRRAVDGDRRADCQPPGRIPPVLSQRELAICAARDSADSYAPLAQGRAQVIPRSPSSATARL